MALIRHVAGIPTATEQRCVRCCEVIQFSANGYPFWPGKPVLRDFGGEATDCAPHDPHAIGEFKEPLREALDPATLPKPTGRYVANFDPERQAHEDHLSDIIDHILERAR